MARPLINLPQTAKPRDTITIKTLISPPTAPGLRPAPDGRILPRNLAPDLGCRPEAQQLSPPAPLPASAANPYLTFTWVATRSGRFSFTWRGDGGFDQTESAAITVA